MLMMIMLLVVCFVQLWQKKKFYTTASSSKHILDPQIIFKDDGEGSRWNIFNQVRKYELKVRFTKTQVK